MPPANITIRPGTAADADAISQVHYEALDQFHEFYGAFFKKHPRELVPLMTARAFAKKEPAQIFYVAADGDDVVGFVRYCIEEAKDGDEEKAKEQVKEEGKKEEEEEESPYACKEAMKELWKAFSDAQAKRDEMVDNAAKDQRHMWIQHLMIRPSHQRRGIGHALLSTALQRADEQTLPAVIVSSAESVALYRKLGFVSQGSFRIDNGHWAREVARVQPGQASEMLVERYDGVFEVEDVMVRAALGREY
ncbi:Acyl-CoA N-acyltransferase [Akanthomyces lecanii RCEF 1005]|uniref:Acyl-CoA N-acyltransferase n=1 Tax=Akanthomyces lecanii RCEF 1005 TaxID=1081108 RepID=A0A168JIY2_CORDF|nr:Acyl-CoA N-acyltransferase [Akanthomyces lecanii RCEF 1005]